MSNGAFSATSSAVIFDDCRVVWPQDLEIFFSNIVIERQM
jgi:hypothetical protein